MSRFCLFLKILWVYGEQQKIEMSMGNVSQTSSGQYMPHNKRIANTIRVSAALLSIAFIGIKLWQQAGTGIACGFTAVRLWPMIVAVLLVAVNWGIEAFKWQLLTTPLQQLSFSEATCSVLTGLAVSMFTPNRIGDFAGRAISFVHGRRLQASLFAIVGGVAQSVAIALFGVVAFWLHNSLPDELLWIDCHFLPIAVLLSVLALILTAAFLTIGKWTPAMSGCKWQVVRNIAGASLQLTPRLLATTLLLSAARYCVFASQFTAMLAAFGVSMTPADAFCAIAFMYCFVTLIPTFAMAEWGVRGSMALLFILPIGGTAAQIVAASIGIWIINVAIPATIGAILLINTK